MARKYINLNPVTSFEQFKDVYKQISDLDLNFYKEAQMKRRIHNFMLNNGFHDNYTDFLDNLNVNETLFDSFFKHLTINVTQFFRDTGHWDSFINKIVPDLMKSRKTLKLWSAGCSSGQEPYTLAMIFAEHFPDVNYTILATDIDNKVLVQAKAGVYTSRDFATPQPNLVEKYMTQKSGDTYEVKDILRRSISFRSHNLLIDDFPTNMDFIACRNVVIYFTEEAKSDLYRKFVQALSPEGVLFTGSTEHIFGAAEIGLKSKTPFFYYRAAPV
ncbi:MAG: protein-glutamate O-methyltransferase CheR [Peptococcaceae bacterium]|nr:protein-glutamate O-methyltransferase CheR [Peptococcaceae bacterium]